MTAPLTPLSYSLSSPPLFAVITVTLKDGKKIEAVAWVTTPMEICKNLSNSLAKAVVVAKVNGKAWDLLRPLEESCDLEFFDFTTKEGSHTFWHSSAHILGQAIELEFKDAQLTIGPPLDDGGFYYDVKLPDGVTVTPADYDRIQKRCDAIIRQKQGFVRVVLTKEEALEMFKGNPFKEEIISKRIPDGDLTTAYRCGPLIDLCRGPHVLNTGKVTAMTITRNSSAYWGGDSSKPQLQRVYGIAFPTKAELEEYKAIVKAAEERDHRHIGTQQELYFFHPLSPGSAFFMPHGARIYNKLQDYIRGHYHRRGYSEVITPNLFHGDLWRQSGHYANYRENMFSVPVDGHEHLLKSMNCPTHCLMFAHRLRSYRELPIRLADFGVLHRNELSGALTGLTRVRRFQQDDAHIFARRDQIQVEVAGVLDMLQEVYGHFGFKFTLCLSTRPEKFLGEIAVWDDAEDQLKKCLDAFCTQFGHSWVLNPGDGAFYGPKIDIQLTDALKRKHQCGTCQLDFQLPIRFGLSYRSKAQEDSEEKAANPESTSTSTATVASSENAAEGEKYDKKDPAARAARAAAHRAANEKKKAEEAAKAAVPTAPIAGPPTAAEAAGGASASAEAEVKVKCCSEEAHDAIGKQREYEWKEQPLPPGHERPVIIHRAILGSVERMMAVLVEHTAGLWPFWLSPRQIIVIPTTEQFLGYAREVHAIFHKAGYFIDIADSNKQFKKKIAEAAVDGYNFQLIVGEKEATNKSVNVRMRDEKKQVEFPIQDCLSYFAEKVANYK